MKIKCNLTYLYLDAEWPRACWFFVDHVPENCNVLSAAFRVYDSLIPLH